MTGPYDGLQVPTPSVLRTKRRYSVTQDVVAYRRCPRQYGAFHVHNYAPAHQTQLYFGTILHQVLDRCHSHYHGVQDPATRGQIPDGGRVLTNQEIQQYFEDVRNAQTSGTVPPAPPTDIMRYFQEVEDGLKSQNIRAVTPDLRYKVVRILQCFNHVEGPDLYPLVVDTEHRLQADRQNHILHGVVDLLVDAPGGSRDPANCEMWDYKGVDRLRLQPRDMETYRFQMQVYAKLYELKHGVLPRKAVLYFLNELDGDTCPARRPRNALMEIPLDSQQIAIADAEFAATVTQIEDSRDYDCWPAAAIGGISEQDCAICDLRWDCPTPNDGHGVQLRFP